MNQLGELKKSAEKFEALNVEVIAVFREESKGLEGLELIKEKTGVEFTLTLDTGAEKTRGYSSGKGEFSNYVVDRAGVIQGVIKGDLRNRANAEQLMKVLESLDP